jgi:hypothetical protein
LAINQDDLRQLQSELGNPLCSSGILCESDSAFNGLAASGQDVTLTNNRLFKYSDKAITRSVPVAGQVLRGANGNQGPRRENPIWNRGGTLPIRGLRWNASRPIWISRRSAIRRGHRRLGLCSRKLKATKSHGQNKTSCYPVFHFLHLLTYAFLQRSLFPVLLDAT